MFGNLLTTLFVSCGSLQLIKSGTNWRGDRNYRQLDQPDRRQERAAEITSKLSTKFKHVAKNAGDNTQSRAKANAKSSDEPNPIDWKWWYSVLTN